MFVFLSLIHDNFCNQDTNNQVVLVLHMNTGSYKLLMYEYQADNIINILEKN